VIKHRSEKGISLAAIVCLGVISMLWLAGTSAIILPIGGRVTKERAQDVARSSAEAALDWAVSQLSSTAGAAALSPAVGATKTVSVPPSVLADQSFSGSITISRPSTGAPSYSYLYDAGIDPNKSSNIQGGQSWHVVTATVKNPGGNITRTVRVILKPEYITTTDTQTTYVTVAGPSVPIFNNAMYAPGDISLNGNATTNSYNSTKDRSAKTMLNGGNVGTDKSIKGSGGNLTVNGELTVYGETTTTDSVVNGSGNVSKSITADGSISSGFSAQTKTAGVTNTPPQLPPVPSAPSNASSLGTLSLSGKNTITLGNGFYIGTDGKKVTVSNGGNYAVNSISMSGQSQIIVDNSGGPVNVYVQGGGSSAGVSITGQGLSNPSGIPGNFRIWYGGTGEVKLSGQGTMTGVIYAPNAPVAVKGGAQLDGAVVGNTIDVVGNGTFLYDEALKKDSTLWWNPPIQQAQSSTVNVQRIDHYQAVSWREY
jgi:hypothetical protein